MTERRGNVWLIGAGLGDPGLLTPKGARALAQCDTLVYDDLASAAIVGLAPPGCEKIDVGKDAGQHTLTQDEITALIVRLGLSGKKVVRLKGGDAFVFARGGEEAYALAQAGVPFEIVPGITSSVGDGVRHGAHTRTFDAQPLFGKRVLVTRPSHQADDFATRLWEAGAEPILAPTIALGPPDDAAAARAAVARVRAYDWAVFTSRNGVDAFFDFLGELGRDARAFGDVKIAAIGPKTAEALAARGIRVDLVPASFVNEAVAAALLARTVPGDRILIYRAQEAREVLPDTLREHGRVADVVAAYKTRVVDDPELAAKTARADIVTFTSASTVAGFVHNVPDVSRALAAKTVAAIGPIAAQSARDAGIRVDVVADAFTVDGLLRALAATAPV